MVRSMEYPCLFYGHTQNTQRKSHLLTMGNTWKTHGCSMDFSWSIPWIYHGYLIIDHGFVISTMKNPWYSHAYPCVFSWIFYGTDHGSSMGTEPLILHGKRMEYFCKGIHRIVIPWPSQKNFLGQQSPKASQLRSGASSRACGVHTR